MRLRVVTFRKRAMLVSLFQPAYSLLPVIGIFLCTVICIADQETASASFVIFYHLAVALWLFQYPVLDFLTFILYLRTYYILVAVRLKFRDICIVHQAGVGHHNEVFQSVFAYKLVYHRQHRVTFIFVALIDAIGKRKAAQTYKQAEYDLRITVSSLFRKAGLAQVVLIIRFKVKCGDIIE